MPTTPYVCPRCRLHLSEGSEARETSPLRGRMRRRSPTDQAAWRFGRALAGMGFDVRRHFIDRWAERAIARGLRAGADQFARWFSTGRHYRDTRHGQSVSFAVTPLGVIVYRVGGRTGNRVVLITLVGALPPGAAPRTRPALLGGRIVR